MKVSDLQARKVRRTGEKFRGKWIYLPPPSPAFSLLPVKDHESAVFQSISTPIEVDLFLSAARTAGLPIPELDWLRASLTDGVQVGYTGPRTGRIVRQNNASALAEPLVVDDLLAEEVEKGFMAGPFLEYPKIQGEQYLSHVNALTLSSKGKYRLCMDLSGDLRGTVNSFIRDEDASVEFTNVDEVVECVLRCGKGALISKFDIKDAFKIVPVHPSDLPLLGIKWRSLYFASTRLVFGLRSAARIFNNISTAMVRILIHQSRQEIFPEDSVPGTSLCSRLNILEFPNVSFEMRHLLDDFILVSSANRPLASHLLRE
jgi:hypothetical protein